MKVNVSKSKIVHYRPSGQERTQFVFKLGIVGWLSQGKLQIIVQTFLLVGSYFITI